MSLLGGLFAGMALGLGLTLLLAPARRVRLSRRRSGLRRLGRASPGARDRAAGLGRMPVRRFRL